MQIILVGLGLLSVCYYIAIGWYTGSYGGSSMVWLFGGILLLVIQVVRSSGIHLPRLVNGILLVTMCAGITVFAIAECFILSERNAAAQKDLDYVIVLGAKIQGERVTRSLKYRLDAAYEYLSENDKTMVIVSGGQGPDEIVTEAKVMKAYLMEKGIAPGRIVMEDQSKNTEQNLRFSREKMQGSSPCAAVVSNCFHVFRAMAIGRKQGLSSIQGIAAKTDWFLFANYMVREAMAVVKDKLVGNI